MSTARSGLAITSFIAGAIAASAVAMAATASGDDHGTIHDAHAMSIVAPVRLPISSEHSFAELMTNADAVMHDGMRRAIRSGHPDHDFASEMIPHHQGAIDMAKVELLYGKDPVLRRVAQEIIVTQQQEIDVMQRQIAALQSRQQDPSTGKKP